MRRVCALLLLGFACGRGLPVHVEKDGGEPADAGASCDLFVQGCPNPTEACYPSLERPPACAPAGLRGEGAPCARSPDCAPGLACLGGEQASCQKLCPAQGSTNPCGEGQSCVAVGNPYFALCTPAGSYSACLYSGGLDHLTLRHSEPARSLCTAISLSSPGNNTVAELSLPAGWEVQSAIVSVRDGGCPATFTGLGGIQAQRLAGRIALFVPDGGYLPTGVEAFLDVYPTPGAGLPQSIPFRASELPLVSCY